VLGECIHLYTIKPDLLSFGYRTCRTIEHIEKASQWMQKFSGKVEISTESRPIETPEMCSDVFQLIVRATRLTSWCPNIYKICLDSSGIGPDGAEAMAAALSQCVGLAELSLRENGLGDRGAEMLSGNGSGGGLGTALVHLDLANNRRVSQAMMTRFMVACLCFHIISWHSMNTTRKSCSDGPVVLSL
jgi:hypothetical protein